MLAALVLVLSSSTPIARDAAAAFTDMPMPPSRPHIVTVRIPPARPQLPMVIVPYYYLK